jgi:C-terminal processing protease CtpA/Prc
MIGEPAAVLRARATKAALLFAAVVLAAAGTLSAQPARTTAPAPIPLPNAGFEEGEPGAMPPRWHGTISAAPGATPAAPNFAARIDSDNPRQGRHSVRLEHVGTSVDQRQFGTITASVEAAAYRGRRVRLTGSVRTDSPASTHVGLWLRIDRPERRPGFFDNMGDRPIRSTAWADYAIEADVAPDAEHLVFGLLLTGPGRAWMDDVRLEVIGTARTVGDGRPGPVQRPRTAAGPGDEPARALTAQGLRNLSAFAELYGLVRYFHPSDEAAAADWEQVVMLGVEQVESARTPAELAARLRAVFGPLAASVEIFPAGRAQPAQAAMPRPQGSGSAVRWRHVGLGEAGTGGAYGSSRIDAGTVTPADIVTARLEGGVTARVPIVLWRDAQGRTMPRASGTLPPSAKPAGFVPAGFDRTSRLAAVIEAWAVLQHGYPYFDVVRTDWERQLPATLRAAATDADDFAFHRTLLRMVAALQDGHGNVGYPDLKDGMLPVRWEEVEGRLMITSVGEGVTGVSAGDIVTHIAARPTGDLLTELAALASGSRQWTRYRARSEALRGRIGETVELRLLGADGRVRSARVSYREPRQGNFVRVPRPEPIAQIAPGIFYVDLDRVTDEMIAARQAELTSARGLVFDLRGYPRGSPDYLMRLARSPFRSALFEPPVYLRPNREGATFSDGGWSMEPRTPAYTSNAAFITDGSAISYAESVLGTVRANNLGEIVGEPTAGANGNVTLQTLPGGYRLVWTGMRVRNRDGSQHHLLGVRPTVPVSRTIAGVRAGRDEMLERALALVQSRAASGAGSN